MVTRFFRFLIVPALLFLSGRTQAQQHLSVPEVHILSKAPGLVQPPAQADVLNSTYPSIRSIYNNHQGINQDAGPQQAVASDHYVKNLAFFCREEIKLEKAIRIPLRFRVGSLEQCNTLEGK